MGITAEIQEPLTRAAKEEIVREVIERFLIPKFYSLGFDASGQWVARVEARDSSIWGMDYTEYLVRGRGPNKDQDPQAIRAWAVYYGKTVFKDWVEAKGLDLDPIAVAYNIAKNGTRLKKQGGSDLLEVLTSRECLEFIASRTGEFLAIQVEAAFKRELKQAFQ